MRLHVTLAIASAQERPASSSDKPDGAAGQGATAEAASDDSEFLDPITCELVVDPVVLSDGRTYDRCGHATLTQMRDPESDRKSAIPVTANCQHGPPCCKRRISSHAGNLHPHISVDRL